MIVKKTERPSFAAMANRKAKNYKNKLKLKVAMKKALCELSNESKPVIEQLNLCNPKQIFSLRLKIQQLTSEFQALGGNCL